jgi:aminoglycoside 2'-N-acetyltransferase I
LGANSATAILTFAESAIPAPLKAQVAAMHAGDPLRAESPRPHDPDLRPDAMLLVRQGRVLSALSILSKEIVHAGERFAAAGLSRVVTHPDERRRGYGRQLVRAAREAMAAGGADLGIFTADQTLRPFYERCGWQVLPGTVLIGGTPERPFPSDLFDKITFASFFTPHARRHAHAFNRCRVALYPGAIDRLW